MTIYILDSFGKIWWGIVGFIHYDETVRLRLPDTLFISQRKKRIARAKFFVFSEIFTKYLWITAEYENEKIFKNKILYELFKNIALTISRDLLSVVRYVYVPKYDFYIVQR